MPFSCSKCGICCHSVGVLVEKAKQFAKNSKMSQEIAQFPYEYSETGRCEKLSLDNICMVYDQRPDVCNVTVMHKKYYSHLTEEEFFKLNQEGCKTLQSE